MLSTLPLDDLARALLGAADAPSDAVDFRQVVEQADIGLVITQDGLVLYANPKMAEMHGYRAAEMVGMHHSKLVAPAAREQVAHIRRLRDAGHHHAAYESRNQRRDGSEFDTRIFGRSILYRGRPVNLTTVSDISEIAEAQRSTAWHQRMLLSTELMCRSGSVELLSGRRAQLSPGLRALLQIDSRQEQMPAAGLLRFVPAEEREAVLDAWTRATLGTPFELHHQLERADGQRLRVLHRGLIERAPSGGLRRVAMLQDVSEHAAAQAQIDRLENCHPVTGLATRAPLLRQASTAVERALREQLSLAMLYVRLPELDHVHGALGLDAGDALTMQLAARLVEACRATDTVAQLGTGEFAVLLDAGTGTDESAAVNTASRILAALQAPVMVEGTELHSSVRIGVAFYPGDASTASELLEHAQVACGRGEGGVAFFTREVGAHATRRIRLEAALRHAFARGELELHYQPQVDLRNGMVIGAEALLRWNSAEFGPVPPDEFVPIAEEAGLIVAIGEWVFRIACQQSVLWAQAGLPPLRIGVNLSPRQLEQPDISQRLQTILLETGADPEHLGIEVTESVLMRDLEHARRTLNELSAIGIELSLDDFGTGYSNLGVLRALPFDVLKIDRSLVHDVTAAPEDVSITRAVLALARGLKIKVLAEGVETEGQLNLLISNGCEFMQGFVFSRPVPAAKVEEMLREGRRLPEQFVARQTRKRTLLLVDDEENVLSSLRRLLRSAGYHIVIARSGPEGLARLAEHNVDVIISDQRMPGMTGVEFLRRAKELYPDTVRIVLSGYTELQSITDAINEGSIYKFLTKPWEDQHLRAHVAEAFERKEMSDENRRLTSEVRSANLELAQANERQQALLTQQSVQLGLEEVRALNAQELLENLPTALAGIDAEGTLVFVNREARRLMADAPLAVGWPAEQVLPADWLAVWRDPDTGARRIRIGGRGCLLSCAVMHSRGSARGHVLSIVPEMVSEITANPEGAAA